MPTAEHDSDAILEVFTSVDAEAQNRPKRAPPAASSVKINVEGAFIVDEAVERDCETNEHVHWEHKDIRLPHHTDIVSHVAVDVRN